MSALPAPSEVFFSYAHEDELLRNELEKHLSLLRRQGFITAWHDRLITPGTDWMQTIDDHLESASIILLLISADFVASDYCYGIEMQRALQRNQTGQALVLPILLRPVDWKGAAFGHLQVLPTNAQPITVWKNQDEAFADVAVGIYQAIENFTRPRVSPATVTKTILTSTAGHAVLGGSDVTIGRAPDNTYVIDDSQVSGYHAVVRRGNQGYAIIDLKSANGTFVNGQVLPAGIARLLRQGDAIRVGATTFEYSNIISTASMTATPIAKDPVHHYTPTTIIGPGRMSPTDRLNKRYRFLHIVGRRGTALVLSGILLLLIIVTLFTFHDAIAGIMKASTSTLSDTQLGQQVIQQYYDDLNQGNCQDAYALWNRPQQSVKAFCDGFQHTIYDDVRFGNATKPSESTVKVSVTITVLEKTQQGETQRSVYTGYYIVSKQNDNSWKITYGDLNAT